MMGIYFFNFASCESLSGYKRLFSDEKNLKDEILSHNSFINNLLPAKFCKYMNSFETYSLVCVELTAHNWQN